MFALHSRVGIRWFKLTITQVPSSANPEDIAKAVRDFSMRSHRYREVLS